MTSHLDVRLAMIRRRLRRRWPNGMEFALLPKADQKALAALVRKWGRDLIHKAVDGAETRPAHLSVSGLELMMTATRGGRNTSKAFHGTCRPGDK
jgi:hypothetical protein